MQIFPLGFILIAIFLLARFKSPQSGFIAAMAVLPLGALALINIGNFSLITYHGAFLIMLATAYARKLISPMRYQVPRIEMAGVILVILVVYGLISSQLMPRLFAGDIWVFPLQSGVVGQRISPYFLSSVTQLYPSSGNISQPVYFLLSALVFLLALRMARKLGSGFMDKSILMAATVNGTMGALDFIGADAFLALFKTAEYTFMVDVGIAGVSRIVGVLPEASTMGGHSAVLFAYTAMRYLDTGKRLALCLAGLNLAWGILALSSTGIVATAFAGVFIAWRSGSLNLSRRINPRVSLRFLLFSIIVCVLAVFTLLFSNIIEVVLPFLDNLIFRKSSSLSALERGAWARRGFEIGLETYGLGAGLGSTRSNGLFSVLFSNLGVIGIVLFSAFLLAVLEARRSDFSSVNNLALYNAAAAALMTSIVVQLISTTTADPGVLFMVFAAIAVSSKPAKFIKRVQMDRTRPSLDQRIYGKITDK